MATSSGLDSLALGLELQPELHGVTGDIKRAAHGDEVVEVGVDHLALDDVSNSISMLIMFASLLLRISLTQRIPEIFMAVSCCL